MRLAVGQIWRFLDLNVEVDGKTRGLNLNAGNFFLENIPIETIVSIQNNQEYHSDTLEELFINREVLWQPNVYDRVEVCITNLSVFSVFCQEEIEKFKTQERGGSDFYTHLLTYLSELGQNAIKKFSKVLEEAAPNSEEDEIHDPRNKIPRILGHFRKECFPVIKIFIDLLPEDDLRKISARHRMDFAVQVIINQYNLKYSDIINPYWIIVDNPKESKVSEKPAKETAKKAQDPVEESSSQESQNA